MKKRATVFGLRLFSQAEIEARDAARSRHCPVWIIRTKTGFQVELIEPPFGEFWKVEPNGQLTTHEGPVS